MSEVETDHESDRINNTGGRDNDLTTYGAISLFTSALNNALSTSDIINAGLQHLLFLQVTVSNLDAISYKRPIL
jgi:hypothetical protein